MNPREFVVQCLSDTGFLCRELLEYNYDEDGPGGKRINVGTGGIYKHGAHQKMVETLDSELRYKLVEAPRDSRKSTLLNGFCVRHMLRNQDIRIMYFARTDSMVLGKATAIRNQLCKDRVVALFGEQVDRDVDPLHFTLKGRREHGLMNATFEAYSMDSMPTGGRANIVILDDFIDDTNCTNQNQLDKSKDKFAHIQPFVAAGGILVVVGTRWDPMDLYSVIESSPLFHSPYGEQLILGAGVHLTRTEGGSIDLEVDEGGVTFPHLTVEYLRQKLFGMVRNGDVELFMRQYLNQCSSQIGSMFRRFFFRPLAWGDDMLTLSGYLLTDTATSQQPEGSQSVVAYVGLDASDNIYVLDVRVGNWQMNEFIEEYFDVLEKWQPKVNHCGEVWESISLASAYRQAIEQDARSRRLRVRHIEINRYTGERKQNRIQSLSWPMLTKRFFVVDTVPRTYEDLDGTRPLWDPRGFYDARTKEYQPAGELVDQFLRFRRGKRQEADKLDIADAIAMILEEQKVRGVSKRYCVYRPWRPKPHPQSLTEARAETYHREEYHPSTSDWWEKTLGEHGF